MLERNYYQNPRPEIKAQLSNKSAAVLELGCGEGFFGYAIKQCYNSRVTGIELSEEVSKQAWKRLGRILQKTIVYFESEL